jgi:hypothetical protein
MKYIHIKWLHELPDAPTDCYAELDDNRMEVRKIEIFLDQSVGYAMAGRASESTNLRSTPVPYLSQLNQDPRVMADDIEWFEFNDFWERLVEPRLR